MNRLSSIQFEHLPLQELILQFEDIALLFQTEDNLVLGVTLDHWLVLDVHDTGSIVEGADSLFDVGIRGSHAGNHEGFRGAAQTVHEEHRQLGVSIGDVLTFRLQSLLVIRQHRDHLSQRKQTLIDVACLRHHRLPLALRLLQSLTSCQVHERNLAVLLVNMACVWIFRLRYQVHCEQTVRPRRVLVELVAADMPVLHPLVQHREDVVLPGALHNHEVLYEESVFHIPSGMENARGRVEKIPELFIIDFQKTGLDVELLLPHRHSLPHKPDSLQEKAVIVAGRSPAFLTDFGLITGHGECFPGACLAIGEYGRTVAVECSLDELVDGTHGKDLTLAHILVHNRVKCILLASIPRHGQYNIIVVHALEASPIVACKLMRLQRPASNGDLDSFTLIDPTLGIVCFVLLSKSLHVSL